MPSERKNIRLNNRLGFLPNQSGVYIYKDENGKIIYIGKAVNLKSRISSYFSPSARQTPKIAELVSKIADFEFIVTEGEQEAFLLENSLIKKNKPRYNARLKDDKSYPYIKVDINEEYPRVYVSRKRTLDGSRYFGPYASPGSIRGTLDMLNKLFPFRSCTKKITGTDSRPCLEFHIKRCIAPCTGNATKHEYNEVINQVISFLQGKTTEVTVGLTNAMKVASKALEFEKAALFRDQLQSIEKLYATQKVVGIGKENIDVLGLALDGDNALFEILFIRDGIMTGHDNYLMEGAIDETEDNLIPKFMQQFYTNSSNIPDTILSPLKTDDEKFFINWIFEEHKRKITILIPKRGEKRKLILMASENAKESLYQLNAKTLSNRTLMEQSLSELQEELSLPKFPRRIECFDISHIQGTHIVASMSVFENGQPRRSDYRRFKIKTIKGNDDYASMKEVITRRLKRLKTVSNGSQGGFRDIPDLILIDGGKGQLASVLEVILFMGLSQIPVAAIAKRKEEIFLPYISESILLRKNSQALFVLQRCRDEAHRFAVNYHRNIRSRSMIMSPLDSIPGIGPKKKENLLQSFGSLTEIRKASVKKISDTPGITEQLALKIKDQI